MIDTYVHRGEGEVIPVMLPATHCLIWRCKRPIYERGYCTKHFREWNAPRLRAGWGDGRQRLPCSLDGCGKPSHAKGMCRHHYSLVYNATRRAKRDTARRAA